MLNSGGIILKLREKAYLGSYNEAIQTFNKALALVNEYNIFNLKRFTIVIRLNAKIIMGKARFRAKSRTSNYLRTL